MTTTAIEAPTTRAQLVAPIAAALGLLSVAWVSTGDSVSEFEAWAFRAVNGLPDALMVVLWPTMQLGTRAMWVLAPLFIYALTRRRSHALVVLAATVLAWISAASIKAVADRPRPETLLDGVELRVAAPESAAFVSAHTAIACALLTAVWPLLPARLRPWALAPAVGVGVARMFVGVHLPLDVVGGAALGVAMGLAVRQVAARARRPAACDG